MAPGYTNKLAGYPVFGVACIKDRAPESANEGLPLTSILVVGGGGAARSGVSNCITVYEIEENGKGLGEAKAVLQHQTGSEVCTSIDASPTGRFITCSMGASCGVFSYRKLSLEEMKKRKEDAEKDTSKKPKSYVPKVESNGELKMILQWTTDVPSDEDTPPCQNVAKFGCEDSLLATGGDDNCVHVWKISAEEENNDDNLTEKPKAELEEKEVDNAKESDEAKRKEKETVSQEPMTVKKWKVDRLYKLVGHSKEIRDLSFDPSGKFLASASKDQGCRVWDLRTGKLAQLLPADTANGLTYRRCTFSSSTELITLQIPNGGRGSSYIVVWRLNPKSVWEVTLVKAVAKGMATSFFLTRNPKYVGLACADGSISLLDRETFNVLKTINDVHNLPITGLCSAYSNDPNKGKEYLMSGSIDRIVSVVPVQHSHLKWILLRLILTMLLVLMVFAAVSRLFPTPTESELDMQEKEL